jgi:antitoxin VapB
MAETGTAKIFKHGRSQAVRLPKEFRLPGKEVRVRRFGRGVLLEPLAEGFDFARGTSRTAVDAGRRSKIF